MSRIGKKPITVPKDVKVNIAGGNVNIQGPKGKLDINIPNGIKVEVKDDKIDVSRGTDIKQDRANHGTIRSRLAKMVIGVTKGHQKVLELQGIGYRAQLQGKKLIFNLGFSHQVEYDVPDAVKVNVAANNVITVEGADNILVGQVAAQIKALKPVEPYKGKGFRYQGEFVRRKQGKSVTK